MIVVATHNDIEVLESIINDLNNIDLNGHNVSIIDTNSDEIEFKNRFDQLKNENPQFNFIHLDYTCWDSGAYIWTYKNFNEDKFIFLQDSIEILDKNFIKVVDENLNNYDVVALSAFPYRYDDPDQKTWVESGISFKVTPKYGIFGPIFAATKEILDKIPNEWLKYPTKKLEACGMERRWSLMFDVISATKAYLQYDIFNPPIKYINKKFLRRDN